MRFFCKGGYDAADIMRFSSPAGVLATEVTKAFALEDAIQGRMSEIAMLQYFVSLRFTYWHRATRVRAPYSRWATGKTRKSQWPQDSVSESALRDHAAFAEIFPNTTYAKRLETTSSIQSLAVKAIGYPCRQGMLSPAQLFVESNRELECNRDFTSITDADSLSQDGEGPAT